MYINRYILEREVYNNAQTKRCVKFNRKLVLFVNILCKKLQIAHKQDCISVKFYRSYHILCILVIDMLHNCVEDAHCVGADKIRRHYPYINNKV